MAKDSAYKVDYNDKQLKTIDKEGAAAVKDSNAMYDDMIKQSDGYFQSQIDAVNEYGEEQKKNQQEQTDFAIEEINQQKEQLHQDYLKEQSGAYADWQKQSDQYGANAEQMAASGLANTGYSESSQVSMYNTYQNRVATARETYVRAKQNYDNAITEARLQNNSLLAEIAFTTLQTSLELSLQGFQYKNTLIQDKAAVARDIDRDYYNRYQDRINQINTENAMAEQIRQFNQSHQLEIDKYKENQRQFNTSHKENQRQFDKTYQLNVKEYNLKVKQYNEQIRQFNTEIARLKAQDKAENKYKIQQLELQKAQLQEQKRQFDKDYELQKKNLNNSGSGGSSGGSGGSSGGSAKNTKSTKSTKSTKNTKSTKDTKSTKKTTSSSNPKIDMDSVIALGYGPISASKLNELVNSGEVIKYTEGGKTKFMRKPNTKIDKNKLVTYFPGVAKTFGFKK